MNEGSKSVQGRCDEDSTREYKLVQLVMFRNLKLMEKIGSDGTRLDHWLRHVALRGLISGKRMSVAGESAMFLLHPMTWSSTKKSQQSKD